MRAVERAHEELTGHFKPFWRIAVELYDRHGTGRVVRDEIHRLYREDISEKTASLWINRGMAERRRELGAASEVAA
jgi:hypothetical protein